jgi:hypothetical protein
MNLNDNRQDAPTELKSCSLNYSYKQTAPMALKLTGSEPQSGDQFVECSWNMGF